MGRPGLSQHRKFKRLARALGSHITARGVLELLWETCYESGEDYVGTPEDIEGVIGWTGEPGALAKALDDVGRPEGAGFIELVDDCGDGEPRYRVHDLWHHAPEYVTKRRKRELERRVKVEPSLFVGRTAPDGGQWRRSPECQAGDGETPSPAPAPAPSPAPAPAQRDSSEASSEQPAQPARGSVENRRRATAPRGPIEAREPVFLVFPVIGPGTGEWSLSEAQVAEWAALYPGVDVRSEARKALAWLKANQNRRKTAGGMARFMVNWLSRSVDKGGQRPGGGRSFQAEVAHSVPSVEKTQAFLAKHRRPA